MQARWGRRGGAGLTHSVLTKSSTVSRTCKRKERPACQLRSPAASQARASATAISHARVPSSGTFLHVCPNSVWTCLRLAGMLCGRRVFVKLPSYRLRGFSWIDSAAVEPTRESCELPVLVRLFPDGWRYVERRVR